VITNFGGNIRFTPRHLYTPTTDAEILAILDRHAHGKIRVVGALHSWSPAIVCDDAIVDMRHFDGVELQRGDDGEMYAIVGGGCRIKHLLDKLHRLGDVTMPSLGLITEQSIAGAISTATHGAGTHSLSHYIAEMRVAAYDPDNSKARIYTWKSGPELQAARCALGCMGVILSVRISCVPKYDVAETIVPCATLEEVLVSEREFPLQQFFLIPYLWSFFVQRRAVTPACRLRRSLGAKLYRAWWYTNIDIGLHLVIKLLASVCKSPALIRFFYRRVLPKLILKNRTVIDRSEKMLVMEHELFKHLETEIFIPARHLRQATAFVQAVLQVFAGTGDAGQIATELERIGMRKELEEKRGRFTHHYAVTFRRVLPDDALISMTGGAEEPWYAISFITYVEPRDDFYVMTSFLARSMAALFMARPHWGKHFPLGGTEVENLYPRLEEFRAHCRRVDPHGVFRNEFAQRVLFGE
jgi:FAD/FMN-containing dehydrogenase